MIKWIKRYIWPRKRRRVMEGGLMDFIRDGNVMEYHPSDSSISSFLEIGAEIYKNAPPVDPSKYKHVKPYVRPLVNHCKMWMETALENQEAFYLILTRYLPIEKWKENVELSIWDLFEKYSAGDRYGIWTIIDFIKNPDGTFTFVEEDIATLSGSGSEKVWKVENGVCYFVKNLGVWINKN